MKTVELMVRSTCGSCERVEAQIAPGVEICDTELVLVDVDLDPDNAAQSGDRVPVVVIDGEEFACWEVDNADLEAELLFPTRTGGFCECSCRGRRGAASLQTKQADFLRQQNIIF